MPDHPVSALCVLPSPSGEQLELIAVASSGDHVIRVYRIDDSNPLYRLEGHTDTGRAASLVMVALCNRADHYIFILFLLSSSSFLWSPYVIGQTIYIFILFLLLSSSFFFFPRLISAVGDWMSTILRHRVWS